MMLAPDPTEEDGGPCRHCDDSCGESGKCHYCDCYVCENCEETHYDSKAHRARVAGEKR